MHKILVVDDDEPVRKVLVQILMMNNYDVRDAADGREGFDVMQSFEPDLIITDIIMPEQDGVGFIIQAKNSSPATKIIAISGGGRISAEDHLHMAHGLGADITLAKPIFPEDLLTQVKSLLS